MFLHSVRLVLSDWRNALRISGVLYLFCAIPGLIVGILYPVPQGQMPADPSYILPNLIAALLYLFAFTWLAVAWHRYILLDEISPGLLPEFNQSRFLAYLGRTLLIGLVLVGVVVVLIIVSVVIGNALGPLTPLAGLVFFFVILLLSYRLSPVLPAAALGQPLKLSDAWAATSGASGTIVILAVVSAIAAFAINLPAFGLAMLGQLGAFLGLLWTIATGWLTMMVGVSVATTIYGHYIEKRAIPAN